MKSIVKYGRETITFMCDLIFKLYERYSLFMSLNDLLTVLLSVQRTQVQLVGAGVRNASNVRNTKQAQL